MKKGICSEVEERLWSLFKAELGARRDQIVANRFLVPQEFVIHHDANGVAASILRAAVAFSIAIETCQGIRAAGLQHASQNILDHTQPAYRDAVRADWRVITQWRATPAA